MLSSILLYYSEISTFAQELTGRLVDTFGTSFPALPFAALLSFLFALRWRDLHEILKKERGLTSRVPRRAIGTALLLMPLAFRPLSDHSLELSALTLISAFYGTSLLLNPLTMEIMFPYAALYSVGVTAPGVLQTLFGEPLAELSSSLTAGMVSLGGIPVTWHGTQFELLSRSGSIVSGTVTPGCSSILSLTTFVGLLGLMHIDLKRELKSTAKLAIVGVGALTALNSVRIGILIYAAYSGGEAALWGIHNWIGYAIFLGFYLATLVVYSKMGKGTYDLRTSSAPAL